MYYINYFFIFSIIGHIIETIFNNGVSGILYGYWTPIYGIGTIIILFINKCVKRFNFGRFFKIITLFIFSSIILSIIEASSGYLIKWIFNKELWNYSNEMLNIGKYTSLKMSFIWGISSIFIIYLVKPLVDNFINRIPKIISYMWITLFIFDILSTFILKTQ